MATRAARAVAPLVAAALSACGRHEPPPPYARFGGSWARFIDAEDAAGLAGAYDASRLTVRGDTVVVWLRFQYSEPQPVPGDPSRTFSVTEVRQAVRCAPGLTRDVRMLLRDSAGDSLGGYTAPSPRWVPFAEHGLSERVLVRLCRALPE